ncbi:MAG: S8 family serine peptidase [Cryobacterium sp.]|nr:S8 family serine peptidase [Cryobacterium sp.]
MRERVGRRVIAASAITALLATALVTAPVLGPGGHLATAWAADECQPGNPQFTLETPPALDVLQARDAWQRTDGTGILVAIVDSGIDVTNPHLTDAVVGGINLVGDGTHPNGYTDYHGHGTTIAGQIAAREIPGSGVVGLAPGAQLLAVRVFRGDDDESVRNGYSVTPERIAAGIRYAADNGAQIINVSLSDSNPSEALETAVAYATARGSLVVASAGNRATATVTTDSPRYPGAYPGALAVAATDASGVVTSDSIHGNHVDLAAPGANVLSTATGAGDCFYSTDAPSTSWATGYVSGAAALVAAAHPHETPQQWAYRLTATGIRGNPDTRTATAGWGIIQPYDAMRLLPGDSVRGPDNPTTGIRGDTVTPDVVTITPRNDDMPFVIVHEVLVVLVVMAAGLLGTLGVIAVLRARKRAAEATVERAEQPEPDTIDDDLQFAAGTAASTAGAARTGLLDRAARAPHSGLGD